MLKYAISAALLLNSILWCQKEITFETLFTEKSLTGKSLSGVRWFDNDSKFSFLKSDPASKSMAVYLHDVISGEEKILVSKNDLVLEDGLHDFSIQNYEWSPDGKYILFTGVLPARKIKSGGTFYLYEVKAKRFIVLAESEHEQVNAGFSPDGKKLGFVRNNNIFTADIESGKIKQLTFDGSDVILNGLFDWVYEEEFSIIRGWEWSPDSKSIAFWRLDQSRVPEIKIAKWDSLYFNFLEMRYPKPGAPNSTVKIGVVNVNDGKTVWMNIGDDPDIYVPRIKFTADPATLSIQRLNRLQNKMDLIFADTRSGNSKIILTENSKAWVDVFDDLTFLDNKQFVWTSERDGFKHIYLYDYSGKMIRQLTKGEWEADVVHADKNKVLFSANERGVRYSDVYRVNINGTELKRLTPDAGVHTAEVSPSGKYFIDKYSSSKTPASVYLYNSSGEKIRDLAVYHAEILQEYKLSFPEFFSFWTSDSVELNARIIKPFGFDSTKKYPVLFDIYGGPGSDPSKDKWGGFSFLWHQILAKNGYIIFSVDNRGTGGRGTAFKHIVYKDLGRWEVNDMIEGAKYLISQGYADPDRLGIWGWSYGGYMAALTITKANKLFSTAIAVAPVTDWRFYDNIYTERFMQTPELNPLGYLQSSVLYYSDNLEGSFLLVHGMADDNVHFQNSVVLSEKLISGNKQFRTMFYPGKNHGIRGGMTTRQLYRMMTDFILEKL